MPQICQINFQKGNLTFKKCHLFPFATATEEEHRQGLLNLTVHILSDSAWPSEYSNKLFTIKMNGKDLISLHIKQFLHAAFEDRRFLFIAEASRLTVFVSCPHILIFFLVVKNLAGSYWCLSLLFSPELFDLLPSSQNKQKSQQQTV